VGEDHGSLGNCFKVAAELHPSQVSEEILFEESAPVAGSQGSEVLPVRAIQGEIAEYLHHLLKPGQNCVPRTEGGSTEEVLEHCPFFGHPVDVRTGDWTTHSEYCFLDVVPA